jgi:DNA (cytosine-5)-methyltransferase 1
MTPSETFYNEIDPETSGWLRGLSASGNISAGPVDERDIRDVAADDVRSFRRCHFFAGIGGWDLALRLAGWPDDRPVWTGSCPCQPYSSAGKGKGDEDDRNLWPEFRRLIAECLPPTVFGEQVASKDGRRWLSGVRADLEALGYAVGAADLCAPGVGSPHIRQRLFWVADSLGHRIRSEGSGEIGGATPGVQGAEGERERLRAHIGASGPALASGMGDALGLRLDQRQYSGDLEGQAGSQPEYGRQDVREGSSRPGPTGRMGDSPDHGWGQERPEPGRRDQGSGTQGGLQRPWDDFNVVPCRDGKARRFEPGSFPLAHGVPRDLGPLLAVLERMGIDPGRARRAVRNARGRLARAGRNRVGRLAGYGNAIVPQVAAEFVAAFLEAESMTVAEIYS